MSFLNNLNQFIAIPPNRSFAGISGFVTISESTTDSLEITKHPVQMGATISDHAFKKPISLSMQMQFKDNLFKNLSQIYQSLLSLQQPTPPDVITPFTVVTPKRTYNNMLLETLACTTDRKTENVLSISATFTEVIIVPIATANVPFSLLKDAASNLGVEKVGHKSAILTIAQGIGLVPPTP